MAKARSWSPVGAPALLTLLFLPLAFGWIGPNPLYGYRTSRSISSSELWYQTNELAGWLGVGFSAAAMLINLCLLKSDRSERRQAVAWTVFTVALLAAAATAFSINR